MFSKKALYVCNFPLYVHMRAKLQCCKIAKHQYNYLASNFQSGIMYEYVIIPLTRLPPSFLMSPKVPSMREMKHKLLSLLSYLKKIHTHTCTHTHTYRVYAHTHTHTHTHAHTRTHTVYMHTHAHTRTHTVYMHTHAYTHTSAHKCTHALTHTHAQLHGIPILNSVQHEKISGP